MTDDFDLIPWSIAVGIHEGKPLYIRSRNFPFTFTRASYPQRINIFWTMSEVGSEGLPLEFEFERLETFENRLVGAVEQDKHSLLSVVLTTNGQREFVFHTADVSGFLSRLKNMRQEDSRYPIELQRFDDVDWEYDSSVIV